MVAAPVVPAAQEAEEGEWHEPRRQSWHWAKIAPLHSSLVNRVRPNLKKKKEEEEEDVECFKCHQKILFL